MIYKIEEVKDCVDHIYLPGTLEYMQDLMKATLLAIENSDKYTELQLLKIIRERNSMLKRFTYDLLLGIERVGEVAAKRQLDIRLGKMKFQSQTVPHKKSVQKVKRRNQNGNKRLGRSADASRSKQ